MHIIYEIFTLKIERWQAVWESSNKNNNNNNKIRRELYSQPFPS